MDGDLGLYRAVLKDVAKRIAYGLKHGQDVVRDQEEAQRYTLLIAELEKKAGNAKG